MILLISLKRLFVAIQAAPSNPVVLTHSSEAQVEASTHLEGSIARQPQSTHINQEDEPRMSVCCAQFQSHRSHRVQFRQLEM